MIYLLTSICFVIGSYYLFKIFFNRRKSNDDDDSPFQSNMDRRSLRPSYKRFMRRKLQEDLNHNPYLCVICWNERKNIVLLPCRHLCVCLSCSQQLWNNTQNETCPICRKQVENRLEVYV
jgi:hypothetical protein